MSVANDNGRKKTLLEINQLKKYYPIKGGLLQRVQSHVKAVENVSFKLYEGESLGVVGESGCGKSTLGKAILGLEELTAGTVKFKETEIQSLRKKKSLNL